MKGHMKSKMPKGMKKGGAGTNSVLARGARKIRRKGTRSGRMALNVQGTGM